MDGFIAANLISFQRAPRKYLSIQVTPNVRSAARVNLMLAVVFVGLLPNFLRLNNQIK